MIHDSGKRQKFSTGAIRDTNDDKPRFDLVTPFGLERLGQWYRIGANKYRDRNWEAGMPFTRVVASIGRHLTKFMMGDETEDHLAAVAWNAFALMHYQEMIARGVLPKDLDDMPDYRLRKVPPTRRTRSPQRTTATRSRSRRKTAISRP